MPKISIVVPVYNVENYLVQCLDSLINQTFKDIEIICVDDGSTDNSLKILQEYSEKDNRIIVLPLKHNGLSETRSAGIKLIKGDYVMFVDSDDYLELNTCEESYNNIVLNKADMIVYNYREVNAEKEREITALQNFKVNEKFTFTNCPMDFYYIITTVWGKLYKKEIIDFTFEKSIIKGEDSLYFWKLCLKHNPEIVVLNKIFYNYRFTSKSNSLMHNPDIILNCELFRTIKRLTSSKEFIAANDFTKIHILDRYAKSIKWEIHYINDVLNMELPVKYYRNAILFLKMCESFNTDTHNEIRYIHKIEQALMKRCNININNI